jgi:hypothetical protein
MFVLLLVFFHERRESYIKKVRKPIKINGYRYLKILIGVKAKENKGQN